MTDYDSMVERWSRNLAKVSGRRSVLRSLGAALIGVAAVPLLPVSRANAAIKENGDSAACDYWRYCGIDGFLCACCGGSVTVCPPGTEPSKITWVGTCRNAADGKDYIVSYNDCCGKSPCGRCFCNRNEGDGPLYRPPVSNDYNWCVGSNSNIPYHCTVSRVVGVAGK